MKAIFRLVRGVWRWKNRHRAPRLEVEVLRTPYWGGIELPIRVRNTGDAAARDCRYARRQRFIMDAGGGRAATGGTAWYASDAFDVPGDGGTAERAAYATSDACPHQILSGVAAAVDPERRFEAALVCRDPYGAYYRFRFMGAGEPAVDVWRESPLNGVLHRQPPEWLGWLRLPSSVETREWTAQFK